MENAGDRYSTSIDRELALDLAAIEQQLEQLWQPEAHADDPVTTLASRTSVLNLIVYVPDSVSEERIISLTERLSRMHPCRVILLCRVSDDETVDTRPQIYSSCQTHDGQPDVPCIERIRIPVTELRYRQLVHLLQPLIIPELPAFFWWPTEPPVTDPAFMGIARASNMTVLDSLNFSSARQLLNLATLQDELPSRATVTDLNWHRLQPWRALTAHHFDIPTINWSLSHIREIEIDVGAINDRSLPSQAVLFAAWFAHSLNWKPFAARRTRNDRWYIGTRDRNDEHVRIIIRTRPARGAARGHLMALSVTSQIEQGASSNLSLTRSRDSALIRMRTLSEPDIRLHHAAHHPHLQDEALLTPILEAPARDQVFDGSLFTAVEILELFARPEAT